MNLSKIINESVKWFIKYKKIKALEQIDKRICLLHKEWTDLEKKEIKIIMGNMYAYKVFKNLYGGNLAEFISDDVYQTQILPILNYVNYSNSGRSIGRTYFSDKNYQNLFITGIKSIKCVVHNINGIFYNNSYEMISREEALKLVDNYESLVLKKTVETGHGRGVSVIDSKDSRRLIMGEESDYIIQELLIQHESLSYFNSSSVNVIRITTVFWKGEVYVLGGILRVGAPGAFCDHLVCDGKYPLVIAIYENGELGKRAIDCERGYIYDDVRGKEIKGKILKYELMKELVKKEHQKYPNHGIIGWDLTLDKNCDIRCIEYNVRCPGIVQSQYALGPIFSIKLKNGNTLLEDILKA